MTKDDDVNVFVIWSSVRCDTCQKAKVPLYRNHIDNRILCTDCCNNDQEIRSNSHEAP